MEQLSYLRDVINGKRRRFFNVSPKAAAFFKKWLADYHAASTLEEVLNEYNMDYLLESRIQPHIRFEGKRLKGKRIKIEFSPRAPWDDNNNPGTDNSPPYLFNDEVRYLVLTLVTTPDCWRLRLCPRCDIAFVAKRLKQEYCGSCGRRVAARLRNADVYLDLHKLRIKKCKAALEKGRAEGLSGQSLADFVLSEANKQLRGKDKIGGKTRRVNFITANADAIGIKKGEP